MNIKFYEYMLEIAKEGTLLGAASKLGITQPALSHFLGTAEFQIGRPLFIRNGKGLYPTDAGQIYIRTAEEIVRVKKQVYSHIRQLSDQNKGQLTLGCTAHRSIEIFSFLYREFSALYPDIRLTLKEGGMEELKRLLAEGKIDFLLGSAWDFRQKEFRFLRFFREEIVLAVSSTNSLASSAGRPGNLKPALLSLNAVEDVPFILSGSGTTLRQIADSLFESQSFAPTIVFETDNYSLLCDMIRSNQGIGLIQATYVYRNPDLYCFSLTPRVWIYSGIYYRNDKTLSEYERRLIDLAYYQSRRLRLNERFLEYPDSMVKDILREFAADEPAVSEGGGIWN